MANSLITASDIITIGDQNAVENGVSDLLQYAPLLNLLGAATASNGTQHKYLKETGAPTVGFRAANAGRDFSKSADTAVTIALQIMSANGIVDKALADIYQKGGPAALCAREAQRAIKQCFKHLEKQIIYGTGNDADGFTGLTQALNALSNTMVYGAGGTTALTSVWFIRTNNDETDVQFILGNNGELTIGDTFIQMIPDATGKMFPAYVTPCEGWGGLQVGSAYSIARICNIDGNANGVTDALLSRGLELFPEDRQPNLIVMNKRSRAQLQRSRQAVSTTGGHVPLPTEYEGIPLVVTGSVSIAETVVT